MKKDQTNKSGLTLPLSTRVSYGAGDLASQFIWSFIR